MRILLRRLPVAPHQRHSPAHLRWLPYDHNLLPGLPLSLSPRRRFRHPLFFPDLLALSQSQGTLSSKQKLRCSSRKRRIYTLPIDTCHLSFTKNSFNGPATSKRQELCSLRPIISLLSFTVHKIYGFTIEEWERETVYGRFV